ncbi:MAG TPA: FixH family protein [Rhizomicrobium sp.]
MTRKLTGRGVLLVLAGFFGVIFATNAIFITTAVHTFRGEDEANPYLQGVEYNHTLARRAEQARLGWRASIGDRRLASGAILLTIDVSQPDGKAPKGLSLTGELRHPADEHRDRILHFAETVPGHFETQLRDVTPGRWEMVVSNSRAEPFRTERRLWVP